MSSRVRTGRSIRGLALPPFCTRAERRTVEAVVVKALDNLGGELKGKYYSLATMTEAQQDQLIAVSAATYRNSSYSRFSAFVFRSLFSLNWILRSWNCFLKIAFEFLRIEKSVECCCLGVAGPLPVRQAGVAAAAVVEHGT